MAGPSGGEDKGDGEKDILLSFFCNECGILLRDVTEIFDHHEITAHEGTFSSMRDQHDLKCDMCKEQFSLRSESDKHMRKHADHRTFTLIDYDPADFQTPPRLISKGGGTSVPRKPIKKKPSKKKTDLTPRPFDFDDYYTEDEEDDVLSEKEDDYYDDSEQESLPEEDDYEDPKDPDFDPELESDVPDDVDISFYDDISGYFSRATISEFELSDDSIYPDDASPEFDTLRTLKKFGANIKERKKLRKDFVIAEGVLHEVALRRVKRAQALFEKRGYFVSAKRRTEGKEAYVFNEALGQLCRASFGGSRCGEAKGKRMKVILDVIANILQDSNITGLRENVLHYMCKKDVDEPNLKEKELQRRFSLALLEISIMLRVSRESLKFRAAPKGSLKGDIKLYTQDGLIVDGNLGGASGIQIPSEADLVTSVEVGEDIECIIVIEKETAFHYLTGKQFPQLEKCVLVTAQGQPDVATRIALGKIREYVPKIKFYCLVDYNPGGMQILSTYSFGSAQRAHDNLFLAVQEIQHIGILSHQVHKDDWLELNEDDNTLIAGILKHDYLEKTVAGLSIRLCVQEMTSTQKKTDIDFLIKRNKLDIFVKDAIKEKRLLTSERR